MYNNIGKKIKVLAEVFSVILAIGTLVCGIYFWWDWDALLGIPVIVFGPVVCWILAFPLYGFGQLVEDVSALRSSAPQSKKYIEKQDNVNREKEYRLKRMLSSGLITQDEYNELINQ